MTYKDKSKQRESQRNWVRQKRADKGSTEQGSTNAVTGAVRTYENSVLCVPIEDSSELATVTGKPGDADYNGICTDEWRKERGR